MPSPFPRLCLATLLVGGLGTGLAGCMGRPAPEAAVTGTARERIARLALSRVEFGAVSLIPVRFAQSRIAGPLTDSGRTLYCVSSQMKGRTFSKPERPKLVVQADTASGRFSVIDDDEVCTGQRTEPFPELDTPGTP